MESAYGCTDAATFHQAKDKCSAKDYRLCTLAEAQAGVPAGTGCGFDSHFIWTSNTQSVASSASRDNRCKD
jgi:hypothetical protein